MSFPLEVCPFFGLLSSAGEVTYVACMSQGTGDPDGLSFLLWSVLCRLGMGTLPQFPVEKGSHTVIHLLWTQIVV